MLQAISDSPLTGQPLRAFAVDLMSKIDGYDWSGIYLVHGDMLELDVFVGEPTEHDRIPIGKGVCGTAVSQGKNQVIQDVREIENYLACSVKTRSEIVVLIKRRGVILGQIDIDGHRVADFDHTDEQFLEAVAEILAEKWE